MAELEDMVLERLQGSHKAVVGLQLHVTDLSLSEVV